MRIRKEVIAHINDDDKKITEKKLELKKSKIQINMKSFLMNQKKKTKKDSMYTKQMSS